MTVYDSIERGAADECEPLTGRRPRTFTLTRLLVACVAVGVCAIGATMVVSTHGFRSNLAARRLYKVVCHDHCHNVPYVDGWGIKTRRVCHKVCHKVRDLAAEHERVLRELREHEQKLRQCNEQRKQCLLQPAHDSRLCDEQRKQCIEHAKIH